MFREYGDGSNDELSSLSSGSSNNQQYQEQPLAPGGFINPLKARHTKDTFTFVPALMM